GPRRLPLVRTQTRTTHEHGQRLPSEKPKSAVGGSPRTERRPPTEPADLRRTPPTVPNAPNAGQPAAPTHRITSVTASAPARPEARQRHERGTLSLSKRIGNIRGAANRRPRPGGPKVRGLSTSRAPAPPSRRYQPTRTPNRAVRGVRIAVGRR